VADRCSNKGFYVQGVKVRSGMAVYEGRFVVTHDVTDPHTQIHHKDLPADKSVLLSFPNYGGLRLLYSQAKKNGRQGRNEFNPEGNAENPIALEHRDAYVSLALGFMALRAAESVDYEDKVLKAAVSLSGPRPRITETLKDRLGALLERSQEPEDIREMKAAQLIPALLALKFAGEDVKEEWLDGVFNKVTHWHARVSLLAHDYLPSQADDYLLDKALSMAYEYDPAGAEMFKAYGSSPRSPEISGALRNSLVRYFAAKSVVAGMTSAQLVDGYDGHTVFYADILRRIDPNLGDIKAAREEVRKLVDDERDAVWLNSRKRSEKTLGAALAFFGLDPSGPVDLEKLSRNADRKRAYWTERLPKDGDPADSSAADTLKLIDVVARQAELLHGMIAAPRKAGSSKASTPQRPPAPSPARNRKSVSLRELEARREELTKELIHKVVSSGVRLGQSEGAPDSGNIRRALDRALRPGHRLDEEYVSMLKEAGAWELIPEISRDYRKILDIQESRISKVHGKADDPATKSCLALKDVSEPYPREKYDTPRRPTLVLGLLEEFSADSPDSRAKLNMLCEHFLGFKVGGKERLKTAQNKVDTYRRNLAHSVRAEMDFARSEGSAVGRDEERVVVKIKVKDGERAGISEILADVDGKTLSDVDDTLTVTMNDEPDRVDAFLDQMKKYDVVETNRKVTPPEELIRQRHSRPKLFEELGGIVHAAYSEFGLCSPDLSSVEKECSRPAPKEGSDEHILRESDLFVRAQFVHAALCPQDDRFLQKISSIVLSDARKGSSPKKPPTGTNYDLNKESAWETVRNLETALYMMLAVTGAWQGEFADIEDSAMKFNLKWLPEEEDSLVLGDRNRATLRAMREAKLNLGSDPRRASDNCVNTLKSVVYCWDRLQKNLNAAMQSPSARSPEKQREYRESMPVPLPDDLRTAVLGMFRGNKGSSKRGKSSGRKPNRSPRV